LPTEFTKGKIIWPYLFWWAIWSGITAWLILYAGFPLKNAVAEAFIDTISLALVGVAMFYAMKSYRPRTQNYFYLRVWVVVLAVALTIGETAVLSRFFGNEVMYVHFLHRIWPLRFCYNFLMISFVSLLNWLVYYFMEQQEERARTTTQQQLVKDAELSKLRQQLQPHFLFNSLNSISALVGNRPEEARHMIQQLSDFLRGTLRKEEQQLVTLEEELSHLRLYLDIEKVRFGHRLHTELVCAETCKHIKLPHLILQPVVENSIKFGLYDTTDTITIKVMATIETGYLIIKVTNPFDPETATPKSGTGFGLSSAQRRLYLLYARNDLIQAGAADNLFTTTIKIPVL
jgi:hypothetical protein